MADRDTGPAAVDRTDEAPRACDAAIREMVAAAVASGRVRLAFQPVVIAGGGRRPAFYEGLIRLLDQAGRVVPASAFISAVEPTELGRRLDVLALRLGFAALRERPQLRLSINLSPLTIGDPGWMAELERGIARDATAAERLILELTERSAITMPVAVGEFISALHARGVAFAVDDFGAGYTAMRHLRDFHFDILKIDGLICSEVARNADNRALVMAIVSIARHFEMMTVAERIETLEDAEMLTRIGVDCLQGYLFAAPALSPDWRDCDLPRSA